MSKFGVELGYTGLKQFGGWISEEFLRKLEGPRAAKIYREMSDNDSTIGAILFAVEMLLRNVKWTVEPFSDDLNHVEQAEFVESNLYDMSNSWENTIAEIVSFLAYGWSSTEICYKRRMGPRQKDPTRRSRFDDGHIGWRKLAIRSQDSLDHWEFDEEGGIDGWWQRQDYAAGTKPRPTQVLLPIEKLLLFRTTSHKNNPEGKSAIRRAFVSWYYKKRIQEAEAIGIERDLAGMPIFYLPPDMFDDEADAQTKANLAAYRNIIENVKNDEQAGLLLPSIYDDESNQLLKFELAGTGSRRLIDTNIVVNRYDRAMATTILADFILLGHEKVGSFALASSKTELFATALGAWLTEISSVFNRHGIPRLIDINGWDPAETPTLKPGDIEKVDVEAFATAMAALVTVGTITPGSEDDEIHARKLLGLPEAVPDLGAEPVEPALPDPEPTPTKDPEEEPEI